MNLKNWKLFNVILLFLICSEIHSYSSKCPVISYEEAYDSANYVGILKVNSGTFSVAEELKNTINLDASKISDTSVFGNVFLFYKNNTDSIYLDNCKYGFYLTIEDSLVVLDNNLNFRSGVPISLRNISPNKNVVNQAEFLQIIQESSYRNKLKSEKLLMNVYLGLIFGSVGILAAVIASKID